jgi:hypothetical protein
MRYNLQQSNGLDALFISKRQHTFSEMLAAARAAPRRVSPLA